MPRRPAVQASIQRAIAHNLVVIERIAAKHDGPGTGTPGGSASDGSGAGTGGAGAGSGGNGPQGNGCADSGECGGRTAVHGASWHSGVAADSLVPLTCGRR